MQLLKKRPVDRLHAPSLARTDDGEPPHPFIGGEKSHPFPLHPGWIFACFLTAVIATAYQPVWHAGFIWDDVEYVTGNLTLHTLDGLRRIWFEPGATVQYYPLTFTTFWVEYHLWGLNPFGYHLVNVSLQILNALLLWFILRKLTVPGAWLAAAIFALHPVNVESVAWVTERKNLLSGAFYLGSILVALKFWRLGEASPAASMNQDSNTRQGNWKYFWLAFFLYVCALGCKTSTVPLPAVILLLVWWQRGRLIWRDVGLLGIFFAVGVASGLMTKHMEENLTAVNEEWTGTWVEHCLLASRDVWFYLGKLIWPHPLMPIYPRWTIHTSDWLAYAPFLALITLVGLLWFAREVWGRSPLVGLLYFVALLLPVLGFFNVSYFWYSFVSDHFQYLAAIGPVTLAAAGLTIACRTFGKLAAFVEPALGGILLVTLGLVTWQQARIYGDEETLWHANLDRYPASWPASYYLGNLLLHEDRIDEAMASYDKALKIKPDLAEAWVGLGNAFLKKGQVNDAIDCLQKGLALRPTYALAYNNLGNALLRKGQLNDALNQYQKALALQPRYSAAGINLGDVLFQKGEVDQAMAQFQNILAIEPDNAEAHNNLGNVFLEQGHIDEAVLEFQRALAAEPDYAGAHYDLGKAFLQQRRISEAISQLQIAINLRPGYADARNNLGIALAQNGQAKEAMLQFQKAVEIKTDNAEFHYNFGTALLQEGQVDEAIRQFQNALALQPAFSEAQKSLAHIAWIMATSADPSERNGAKAVGLAQQTDLLTGGKNPVMAGTLAAAYAEAGNYPEAVAAAKRAIELANQLNTPKMVSVLEGQLKLYQASLPFHRTGTSSVHP